MTFWRATTAGPDQPVKGPAEDRLYEAAGDDVRRPDRQDDETPEDPRVHEPGPAVTEHPGLEEGIANDRPRPDRELPQTARLDGVGHLEDSPVARHREHEHDRRAPEQGEDERIGRDLGERLEHLPPPCSPAPAPPSPGDPVTVSQPPVPPCGRSARPAAAAARWSNGPCRVSSACSRIGTTASNDSSAPRGLPGQVDDERPVPHARRCRATGRPSGSTCGRPHASPRRCPGPRSRSRPRSPGG